MLSKLPRSLKSRQLLNNATQLSLRLNLYNVPDGAEPLALSLDSGEVFLSCATVHPKHRIWRLLWEPL